MRATVPSELEDIAGVSLRSRRGTHITSTPVQPLVCSVETAQERRSGEDALRSASAGSHLSTFFRSLPLDYLIFLDFLPLNLFFSFHLYCLPL